MDAPYRFDDGIEPEGEEAVAPAPEQQAEPDAFARMISLLRHASGYDPGADDEKEDEASAGRTQRWAGRSVLVAVLTLAVLNAPSIGSWATTLPPSWASETILELDHVWEAHLAAAGLDGPRRTIHDAYENWKARRISAPPPGPDNH